MEKKLGFDELNGKRINAAGKWLEGGGSWMLYTNNGDYELRIYDDGSYGSDSHAFLSSVRGLDTITGKEIVVVDEESNRDEAEVKLRTADGSECIINITHSHNGYYGFSYELLHIAQ